jgi:integrase
VKRSSRVAKDDVALERRSDARPDGGALSDQDPATSDALAKLAVANPALRAAIATVLNAVLDSSTSAQEASVFPGLSDTRIVDEPDGASPKGKPMHRVHGPYSHHDKWLIKIVDRATRKATNRLFETREEAERAAQSLKRQERHQAGISVGGALDVYERWLAEVGHKGEGNKPRTVETTMQRIRRLFDGATKIAVNALTTASAEKLYDSLTGAVDSRRNILAEAKTFLRWCCSKGWAKINALEHVQGLGRRRRGKPQLTTDEARKFLAKALELAEDDDGAIAATMALLMGMRASEIIERTVRNLDDEGRLLWITDAKTQAGVRRLEVPPQLQEHLQRLARDKRPGDLLFGRNVHRHWVLRAVHRICKAAGVPRVPSHGLRGTHATLAVSAGATSHLVAAALGHESFATTARHYARTEAIESAVQERVLEKFTVVHKKANGSSQTAKTA